MSHDLFNPETKEEFRWTQGRWGKVLSLAEKNGWQPKGTVIPQDYSYPDWDGNYWHNSGQIVEKEDAFNLAQTLTKSLDTLPQDVIEIPTPKVKIDRQAKKIEIENWKDIPVENFFSGPAGRKSLENFIKFCQKGSFTIT